MVNPLRRPFELGKVADRGLIHNAMARTVFPLGTPLLVAKGRRQAERAKDFGHRVAVGDVGLGFDAVLVAVFAGANVGEALVGEQAAPA